MHYTHTHNLYVYIYGYVYTIYMYTYPYLYICMDLSIHISTSVGNDVEKLEPSYILGIGINGTATVENTLAVPQS